MTAPRFLQAVLLCLGVASVHGCATTNVSPGTAPELEAEEGYVAVVVDTNRPLHTLTFSRAVGIDSFTLVVGERGVTPHVLKLPAGRYVLTNFRTPTAQLDPASAGGRVCLWVRAGKLTYPGHFVFRDAEQGQGIRGVASWGWRDNQPDLTARLKAGWPALTERYPVNVEPCRP